MTDATKLKRYRWKGVDRFGNKADGITVAENVAMAREVLADQDITVIQIKEKSSFLSLSRSPKVRTNDIVIFMRQLATMVDAGIPLVHGIDIVSNSTDNTSVRNLLTAIYKDVSAGDSFTKALKKHPKYFSNLVVSLVDAGETSGTLDEILKQISDYLERIDILQKRIKKAMFYPIVVLSVAVLISTALLVYIVPQFEALFASFGKQLPLPTRIVIAASGALRQYWWVVLGLLIAMVAAVHVGKKRSPKFCFMLDKFKLRITVFGPLIRKSIIARTMRTLSLSIAAGVPLVKSLDSVVGVAENRVYQEAFQQVRNNVTTGKGFTFSLKQTELFPNMVLQMIAAGEKSGSLETMLKKISDFYDEEVNSTVNAISTLIEPLMIIVLGSIIGIFVISMYLPVFRLGTIL